MQQKKKICKACGKETFIFSKGECVYCAKKRYVKKKTVKRVDRRKFFKVMTGKSGLCVESGAYIKELKSVNICHIFPKRTYKSIETDENNIIILNHDNHPKLDSYLDRNDIAGLKENMPNSYSYILIKLKELLPLITETSGELYFKLKQNYE